MKLESATFSCIKRSLLTFNVLFWFSGPALIGLSIWFLLSIQMYSPLLHTDQLLVTSYIMIGVGGLVVFAGLCGCIGCYNENKTLILLFLLSLVLVFVSCVYSSIRTFIAYDENDLQFTKNKINISILYYYHRDETTTKVIDRLQEKFECCGALSPYDWNLKISNSVHYAIPESCCKFACSPKTYKQEKQIYKQGCLKPYLSWLQFILCMFGWSCFTFSAIQIAGILLVCCFYHSLDLRYFFR